MSVVRRPPLGGGGGGIGVAPASHGLGEGDGGSDAFARAALPWNERNRLLTVSDVTSLLQRAGITYTPRNLALFQQAFVHPSYTEEEWPDIRSRTPAPATNVTETIPLFKESYNTLEFRGDSVLNLCVVDHLTERYPREQEGFLTKLKIRLVCGSQLSVFTQTLQMQDFILMSWAAEHEMRARENLKVLEDVMEAFLGALFLDSGRDYVICSRLIEYLLERCINFTELMQTDTNYKDQLLRYYAAHFHGATPRYHEIRTPADPANVRGVYVMGVLAPPSFAHPKEKVVIAVGEHKNKKRAEQLASKEALAYYGVTFDEDAVSGAFAQL